MKSKELNQEIIQVYLGWLNELRSVSPWLLTKDYSNIFCTGFPDGWNEKNRRILIVGEEATWKSRERYRYSGDDDECVKCQEWILNNLEKHLSGQLSERNNSPFWKRVRHIHENFPEASIAWTNIDIINSQTGKKLSEKDRKALHATSTRILFHVIQLSNPTDVIFFGWHNTSLSHELPDFIPKLYPSGIKDNSFLKSNGYIVSFSEKQRKYIFTYHPSWGKANTYDYLSRIINEFRNSQPGSL